MRSNWSAAIAAAVLLATLTIPAQADWQQGVAAFKSENWAEAARQFQAVTEQSPDFPGGYMMLGQALQKLKRDSDAVAAFRQAYELNPDDTNTKFKLGEAYVKARKYREAAEVLGSINPSSLPASLQGTYHQLMAVALDKSGQGDRALVSLKQAAAANPSSAAAHFNYGAAAFNAGQMNEAERALGRAVQLDPNDAAKRKAYVDALLRIGRQSRGDSKVATYRKAVENATRLTQLSGTYENFLLLGEAQLGSTDYAGAVSSFDQAAAKRGSDWLPHFYIGQAHTATRNYAEAEAALQRSLANNPSQANQTRVLKQLAFVYEKLKKYSDAEQAYIRAGDPAAAERVRTNAEVAEHNAEVAQEEAEYERLKREEEELKRQLEQLESGPPR